MNTSEKILELAEFGSHNYLKRNQLINTQTAIKSTEFAPIMLAIIVLAGSLTTALCVVCIRYRR